MNFDAISGTMRGILSVRDAYTVHWQEFEREVVDPHAGAPNGPLKDVE